MAQPKERETVSIVVTPTRFPIGTKGKTCKCEQCHTEAWVSDTSIDAVNKNYPLHPIKFICGDCFLLIIKQEKPKESQIMPLTEEQADEIKSLL